jgi:hypothetical protein
MNCNISEVDVLDTIGSYNSEEPQIDKISPRYSSLDVRLKTSLHNILGSSLKEEYEIQFWTGLHTDIRPPKFRGIQSAEPLNETEIKITWLSAIDDYSDESAIFYKICQSFDQSECRSSFKGIYITEPGITAYIVKNLIPGTVYYFAVKAVDASLNHDLNQVVINA